MKNLMIILLALLVNHCSFPQKINLIKGTAGSYEVPIELNKTIKLNFLLDTGASEGSIPIYVLYTLIKSGSITKADKLADKTFTIADGSTITLHRVLIRELKIGDHVIKNVSFSVTEKLDSPLLLGQNVLSHFQEVIINYKDDTLFLKE